MNSSTKALRHATAVDGHLSLKYKEELVGIDTDEEFVESRIVER